MVISTFTNTMDERSIGHHIVIGWNHL